MESSTNNITFQQNIRQFLLGKDLLNLILAVYLGGVLQQFFKSIIDGAIMPIMLKFVPGTKYNNFSDIVIDIHGVSISAGSIIMNFITLFVGFLMAFLFTKYFIVKYV